MSDCLREIQNETDYLQNNRLLNKAIHFAVDKHDGQLRKGSSRPYILHPMETMVILHTMGASIPLQIAGILHDTVEDTDASEEEIREGFGDEIADLVIKHSEDKTKSWEERKCHAIQEVSGASKEYQMLIMADKVSNMRSMLDDYRLYGEDFWSRFNAPKEKQAWYYHSMIEALHDMGDYENTSAVYHRMVQLYEDIFFNGN